MRILTNALALLLLVTSARAVDIGAYDPFHKLDKVPLVYENIWYRWDTGTRLRQQLKMVTAKNRTPILTIEPWEIKSIGSKDSLLPDIAAGKYDKVTTKIAETVKTLDSLVIIRWGHEAECVPTYSWSRRPPADYIAAFREVAAIFKRVAPQSLILWSPVGNKGCEVYYPGDDAVDFVGFTLFEFPSVSVGWMGHPMSFADWMDDKYPRVSGFNKPVIVAEVGIYDTPKNQKIWWKAAVASVDRFPLVRAMLYFNVKDTFSWAKWGGGTETPDWRISPAVFE